MTVTLVILALVAGFGVRPLLMPEPAPETPTGLSEEQMQAIHTEISSLYDAISQLDLGSSGTTDAQLQAEFDSAKAEIALLQSLLKETQETNQTTIVIPPPEIVGEIGWREIEEMLKEIVPNAGTIAGTQKIATKEAIELFLMSVTYPEGIKANANAKAWYLMSKFMEWGVPKLCVGFFEAYSTSSSPTSGIIAIVQDSDGEYRIFMVNEENQLVPFKRGPWQQFTVNFPL